MSGIFSAERLRLEQAARHEKHWRRWGPFLSERAWGTVREDYSELGTAWEYFPFEHSHQRAYRWSEDGLAGWCDNHQRLCFSVALWNGRDPILKERLFGLTGNQGNHSEDVKELYYYVDATPSYSYAKCLYKYPQAEFPYQELIEENRRRTRHEPEYELLDTGVFNENRYFDVFVEYAKADVEDTLIRITVYNRGPEPAKLHVLPAIWFRNTWQWGQDLAQRPRLTEPWPNRIEASHPGLGHYLLDVPEGGRVLFTDNETNAPRLWNVPHAADHRYKDAFHDVVIHGRWESARPVEFGTKACVWYQLELAPGASRRLDLRLSPGGRPLDADTVFAQRIAEADEFYSFAREDLTADARSVQRQAFAGLLWSKQFFHYVVEQWLEGDPQHPPPPPARRRGRNSQWVHVHANDVLTMPDKWEYPWFAAWDTAFHMIPMAVVDPDSAKREISRFLREWYMHPNGQIPAYEWAFDDVNPPVHAWACWRVFQIDRKLQGAADIAFLESAFHKLLMNFTWWVNRKDSHGDNIFTGGFLGLDNIGVFDRSKPLPTGGHLEQSDATSWMAMYCLNMLRIAMELAQVNSAYEDIASKFFEHFLYISHAMNSLDGRGLWDEEDGFFYDRIHLPHGSSIAMRIRSMVGLIPLFAVDTLEPGVLARLPGFEKRMRWFVENRPDLCANIASITQEGAGDRRLLALCQTDRLRRVLRRMLDETEFLSPYGLRSLSRYHREHPFTLQFDGTENRVDYEPAESATYLFGGNSNWRGPVWFPVNYLMIESLQKFNHYFGPRFQVEFPTGSGREMTLGEVATELSRRLARLFVRDSQGRRPVYGDHEKLQRDPYFRDYVLFYEYFHGDTGAGVGASHQTGWTALVAKLIQQNGV